MLLSELRFLTITGRPGSGKSTLIKKILEVRSDCKMFEGKSFTTRPPRNGDVSGEYQYVCDIDFARLKQQGEFAWAFEHGEYMVGTRHKDIHAAMRTPVISIMTLVPEAVYLLQRIVTEEKIISCFLDGGDSEFARMLSRGDEVEKAEERFRAMARWSMNYMFDLGVKAEYILNPAESPPAASALEEVLDLLDKGY